jgi:hypothetical protein
MSSASVDPAVDDGMTPLSRTSLGLAALLVLAGGVGCSETSSTPVDEAAGGPPPCAAGSMTGPDGGCMPVGIQGCAALFLGDDNLCHPSMAQCPVGTIPKLDEGCIAVGLPRCAKVFLEEDGVCRPSQEKCGPGTFAVPEEGCVPLDGPDGCGQGTWGNIVEAPGDVYVDPRYPGSSSDGSRARPMTTIAGAMARVRDGGRVVLAEGTYGGTILFLRSIGLVGRCASRVRLQEPSPDLPAAIVVGNAHDVAIRAVTLGVTDAGVLAIEGARVALDEVHIEARFIGVLAAETGTEVSLSHCWVTGAPYVTDSFNLAERAAGVAAWSGAHISVTATAFTGATTSGVVAPEPGAEVHVTGSLIEGTRPLLSSGDGGGAVASSGGAVTLTSTAVVESTTVGVSVEGEGSSLVVTGSLVADTVAHPGNSDSGYGAWALDGGRLTVESTVFRNNTKIGIFGSEEDTAVTVTQSLVHDTARGPHRYKGSGIWAQRGAQLVLRDSAVFRNSSAGIVLSSGAATRVEATGNVVEDTIPGTDVPPSPESPLGPALYVGVGEAVLTSNAFLGSTAAGVGAYVGALVTATGNLLENVLSAEDGQFGVGLVVADDSVVTLASNLITDTHMAGIQFGTYDTEKLPTLTMTGDVIRNSRSQPSDDAWGMGIAGSAGSLSISSCIIRDSRIAGLALSSELTTVNAQHCLIEGVSGGHGEREIDVFGDGVLVIQGGTLDLSDSTVLGCSRAGVFFSDSTGSVSRVRASENRYGLVINGDRQPTVQSSDNDFTGNSEQDRISAGNFSVPSGLPRLP